MVSVNKSSSTPSKYTIMQLLDYGIGISCIV